MGQLWYRFKIWLRKELIYQLGLTPLIRDVSWIMDHLNLGRDGWQEADLDLEHRVMETIALLKQTLVQHAGDKCEAMRKQILQEVRNGGH